MSWPGVIQLLVARADNNQHVNCVVTLHTLVVWHKKTPTISDEGFGWRKCV